jgi:transcriptional regulator with XRE-family HTH domain
MNQVLSQKEIGQRLRTLRLARNMKAVAVARRLKVSRQHIHALEAGECNLTLKRLQQFTQIYKVNPDALLARQKRP